MQFKISTTGIKTNINKIKITKTSRIKAEVAQPGHNLGCGQPDLHVETTGREQHLH